jgi:hypothetical protein
MESIEWWHWLIYALGCIIVIGLMIRSLIQSFRLFGEIEFTLWDILGNILLIALSWITILALGTGELISGIIVLFSKKWTIRKKVKNTK